MSARARAAPAAPAAAPRLPALAGKVPANSSSRARAAPVASAAGLGGARGGAVSPSGLACARGGAVSRSGLACARGGAVSRSGLACARGGAVSPSGLAGALRAERPARACVSSRAVAEASSAVAASDASVDSSLTSFPADSGAWSAEASRLDGKSPLEIVDHALRTFGDDVAIAFSGAEDVALIEYAHLTGRPFRVFSLDTGRLNPETYELFDAVEKRYGIRIEYTFPEASETTELVRAKGLFSFFEDGHGECCRVRKVRPLRRQLRGLKAWITGQRRDQSPGTRAAVSVVEVDPVFEGLAGGPASLVKYNPLAATTGADVWGFLRAMGVPTNALHLKGYVSIGCQPCTRPVLPGQHEREGRWWWEDSKAKECGLHAGNVKKDDGEARSEEQGGGEKTQDDPKGAGAAPGGAPGGKAPDAGAAPGGSDDPVVDFPRTDSQGNPLSAEQLAAREAASRRGLWTDHALVQELSQAELAALLETPARHRDRSTLVVLYAPWCPHCQAMEAAYGELAARLDGSSVRVAKLRADLAARPFVAEAFGMRTFPTIVALPRGADGFIKYPSERRDADFMEHWVKAIAGSR